MNKVIQFELWQDCHFGCKFCSLGRVKTSDQFKLENLHKASTTIMTYKKGQYDVIGFIGGEFFNGEMDDRLFTKFCELMTVVNDRLENGYIKEIWLNVSLMNKFPEQLKHILNYILKQHDKLWLLTSYDTVGRFHNKEMFENWESNLQYIHKTYPEIRTNITTIITDDFIDKYISGEFDLPTMKAKYQSTWFFKPTVKPDTYIDLPVSEIDKKIPHFFTTQEKFQTFLSVFRAREGDDEYQRLFSNDLRAEEVVKNYNEEHQDVLFVRTDDEERFVGETKTGGMIVQKCGHPSIYHSYIDTDGCVLCDKKEIGEI